MSSAGLRKLSIQFELYSFDGVTESGKLPADQVFLSKLTGIMAFKKMAKTGVEINFIVRNAEIGSRKLLIEGLS